MSYDFEPLDQIVRGWVADSVSEVERLQHEAERLQFEREYGEYVDEQAKDFDEDAYIKYMEQEEAAFIQSLVNPTLV